MFVQKLESTPTNVGSQVGKSINNVTGDIQQHGDNGTGINDETSDINGRNERPIIDELNLQPKEMDETSSIQVTSPIKDGKEKIMSLRKTDPRLVEAVVLEKNIHKTSLHCTVQKQLDVIVEYATEPLLPLMDACAPLTSIIQDLSRYVRAAISETPPQPFDGLTFDESAAIRLYTMEWDETSASLYSMLNFTLKHSDRQALRPYFRYLKLLLTALVKLPCAPLQTVWRGVNKDLSKDFPPGTPVTWWSFSSCTTSLTVLENSIYLANSGERTLFSVEAINGRIIQAHSHFNFEDEILLLPGTYMEVHSQLSPAADLHIIHLRQIKPTATLLELPFEGALLYPLVVQRVPWYKKKRTIVEISLFLVLCLSGIVVGLVLGTRGPPPPSVCYTRRGGIKADLMWSFDCGDAREDLNGVNNGSDGNNASYSSPDFSGQGRALNLDRKLNQYIRLPHSLNLGVNTSFTVSVWIFSTGYNRAMILSDCNTLNSVCIELYLYSVNVYAETFTWNNRSLSYVVQFQGWRVNYQSCWIHLAFTYDNQTNNLVTYFNGESVVSGYFLPSYFVVNGTNGNGTTSIGLGSILTNPSSFGGLIDQLSISYYVKNDSDIRDEATLLCYYTFESENVSIDSGPNHIPAKSQNVYRLVSNQESTLLFNSTDSFFQSSGFTLLMSKFYEFTIAFWLRPILLISDKGNNAMAILQFSSQVQQISSRSYVCFVSISIINITTDQPYFRLDYGQLNMYTSFYPYIVKNNTWVHVGVSYAKGGEIHLFLDGIDQRYIKDSRFSLLLYNPRLAVTVGGSYFDDTTTIKPSNYESRNCFAQNSQFDYAQFYGEIDDLQVFARALTVSEFALLANSTNKTIPL